MVKSLERWIIRNHKTRVCDRNGYTYTHMVLTLYTLQATKSLTKIIDLSNLMVMTRVCDRNGYTHVVLGLVGHPTLMGPSERGAHLPKAPHYWIRVGGAPWPWVLAS
jgi:hypothetical protein